MCLEFCSFIPKLIIKYAEGPEKKLPQETAEYYSWLLRIERADFEKELMEIVSNKSPSLILNEIGITWDRINISFT